MNSEEMGEAVKPFMDAREKFLRWDKSLKASVMFIAGAIIATALAFDWISVMILAAALLTWNVGGAVISSIQYSNEVDRFEERLRHPTAKDVS